MSGRRYEVVDNSTGAVIRETPTLKHAVHLCRGLNLQHGPGGRYSVTIDGVRWFG